MFTKLFIFLFTFILEIEVFRRMAGLGYREEIRRVYAEVANWDADFAIELHFNAYNSSANGTETMYAHQREDIAYPLATALQSSMLAELNLKDRGFVITERNSDNGHRSLVALPRTPTILVEPFFGDSQRDARHALELGTDGMARMYLRGARDYAISLLV